MADEAEASRAKKAAAAAGVQTEEKSTDENGHAAIAAKIESSAAGWQELCKAVTLPAEGMAWPLAFVADQDEASAQDDGKSWKSHLAYGKLVYLGENGSASYSVQLVGEAPLLTDRGDKSQRGAEYSALEVFAGKLVTFDDRTGNCDELEPADGFSFNVKPLCDADGNTLICLMGDGKKNKPLKCEWSTQKDGKLYVGSTGKERTDDDGNIVHEGEMWIKSIDESLKIEHVDWRSFYNGLRDAAICKQGAGYMIHEGARWSDVHSKWFLLPRKLSREPYDEIKDTKKCVNLMMAAPEGVADGEQVLLSPYLTKMELRGCSDFLFVPGTNDCHIFLTRTEESLDGSITTYASVIDLTATVLMEETVLATERKFEGVAWVGGFGPFPAAGPTATVF